VRRPARGFMDPLRRRGGGRGRGNRHTADGKGNQFFTNIFDEGEQEIIYF